MKPFLNIEIKARCSQPDQVRNYLLANRAEFRGVDRQTDTYFLVANGRLKLREGNIENNLIYYEREDQAGPKASSFHLVRSDDPASLKEALTKALGVKVVVRKIREIYFIGNVKFHLDEVPGLGHFVEIEAGNKDRDLEEAALQEQCAFYRDAFGIREEDLLEFSYSDMLSERATGE